MKNEKEILKIKREKNKIKKKSIKHISCMDVWSENTGAQ